MLGLGSLPVVEEVGEHRPEVDCIRVECSGVGTCSWGVALFRPLVQGAGVGVWGCFIVCVGGVGLGYVP